MYNERTLYALYEVARNKRMKRIHELAGMKLYSADEIQADPEYQRVDRKYRKAYREWKATWNKEARKE